MLFSKTASEISQQQTQSGSMPLYLFAGQSNMEGNVDPALFNRLLSILKDNKGAKVGRLSTALNNWYLHYQDGYAKYAYDPQVSRLEANELVQLRRQGFIGPRFPKPPVNNLAYCTITNDPAVPLADNCGNPFGPELLFSHAMDKQTKSPFTIVKVVKGGTSLAQDWISPSASNNNPGPMYQQLAARIASLKSNPGSIHANCASSSNACKFKAFVWFQGENDCFEEQDANAYANNLQHFISDVRSMLGDPNFPVIIVQIGYWPSTLPYGSTVIQAQANFVKNTPNTILVSTNDLSQYFHFDPAAQLVIGDRVAKAMSKISP